MDQSNKRSSDSSSDQFQYLGRWVNKQFFRAFVYNEKGEQKLADSFNEFESLTASGLWFASKPDASQGKRKQKDAIRNANS